MNNRRQPRLFWDSNILIDAFKAKFGLSKGIISLAWSRLVRLVVGETVIEEAKGYLLKHAKGLPEGQADELLAEWAEFMRQAAPEIMPKVGEDEVMRNRHLIRHPSDVPVLLAALKAQPDWLVTKNRNHFTNEVAEACGIRIADPEEWFTHLINTAEV